MNRIFYILLGLSLLLISCKGPNKHTNKDKLSNGDTLSISYAQGFSVIDYDGFKILKVKNPFPESEETFTYLLVEKNTKPPRGLSYDAKVRIPIQRIIVTSTTHIPALIDLNEINTLVGFPHPDFISSSAARKRIEAGKVTNIGKNTHLNTEIVLSLQPDALIGFSMKTNNKTYGLIAKSGIPVLYNGDWNEPHPLGKAEWIKFFGALYNKEKLASSIFNKIKKAYLDAQKLAKMADHRPTVLAGAMYKDVWYLPKGSSWAAKFIADAQAEYLYKDTEGTGSLSLSIETVLNKSQDADFWIAPGGFTSYEGLLDASEHYAQFKAFQNQNIYSYAGVKGPTGGVLYYELGYSRPDLILKDLIHIFHPKLLPEYHNTFFKPLQ